TDRAIVYRADNGFDHFKVALSVGVMKMVRADLASSGVAFTLDTESGFRDVFYVHKPTYKRGFRAVLRRTLGKKQLRMIYGDGGNGETTRSVETDENERRRYCLSDAEVLKLAGDAIAIEDHYSAVAGHAMPMDIEWAKDGDDGQIYVIQARPETVASQRQVAFFETYALDGSGPLLVTGRAVGEKIAAGPVRIVTGRSDLGSFVPGEVLVAETTSPDWEPIMKQAAAIVTDRGGRTCHAAIVARELGIPAVVGTANATAIMQLGRHVTVSCAEGETGHVYDGKIPFKTLKLPA